MKNFLFITIFSLIIVSSPKADHQTINYDFNAWFKYEVKGSNQYYKFKSNIVEDQDVKKEIENYKKTGIVSYLLFENDNIVIDYQADHQLTSNTSEKNKILYGSKSVGKSLVSYVTGHAICEGYIDGIEAKLDDWPILNNTLYDGQKLIDLLNMRAGDQKYIGEKNFDSDNKLKSTKQNVNTVPLKFIMQYQFKNKKKSKATYNYNALATNIVLNYTIFKSGNNYQSLLNKVFKDHAKIKNSVYFLRNSTDETEGSGRYSFYASRYDYLRIGKRILDDWNNDTCVGKYLKTIYEQRKNKNKKSYKGDKSGQFSVSQYTKKYGGQFHFDIIGLTKKRILAMDGFGGQQLIIDFDQGRIIVVNSLDRHYNWKKIVLKKLKQK